MTIHSQLMNPYLINNLKYEIALAILTLPSRNCEQSLQRYKIPFESYDAYWNAEKYEG